MAKSKSTHTSASAQGLTPSLTSLLAYPIRPSPLIVHTPLTNATLADLGDRRRFDPTRAYRSPAAITRAASRVQARAKGPMAALRFADPSLVALCKRRQTRREVIFALRKNKAGSGAKKRRNFWSHISCRG